MAQFIELLELETYHEINLGIGWEQIKTANVQREPVSAKLHTDSQPPVIEYPGAPFILGFPIRLNTDRVVYAFSDAMGKGYTSRSSSIKILSDAAKSRLQAMTALEKKFRKRGIDTTQILAHLKTSQAHWEKASKITESQERSPLILDSLRESIAAGEALALQIAAFRTKSNGWRDAFFWGCAIRPNEQETILNAPLLPVMNCLSLDFSQSQTETTDFEAAVRWAQQNRVSLKATGILTPETVLREDHSLLNQRLNQPMDRYRGAIRYWEILTNPHWAIQEDTKLVSLSREMAHTARHLDPQCVRIIKVFYDLNQSYPSAIPYLSNIVDQDTPFECIGLQLSGPCQDYLELDETLERYADFGKPLHLSLSLPPTGLPEHTDHSHLGVMSETAQADWLEAVMALAYSKPYVVSVTVETPLDGPEDAPKRGLFTCDLTPKPSFLRLSDMKALWRSS